jgi:hypothetical protein
MTPSSRDRARRTRQIGLLAGGLCAFLLGGPIGLLAFFGIGLIALVFTIR